MANKSVSGYTQVPVVGADILSIRYQRLNETGTVNQLTVVYNVKDDQGAIRQIATYSAQVASYPISAATIISALNTQQGT